MRSHSFDLAVQFIKDFFSGKSVNVMETVEQLLCLVPSEGLKCTRLDEQLSMESASHQAVIVGPPRLLSLVRTLCTSLAVMSRETTGGDAFLYGGQGEIVLAGKRFHVATMNTPGQQWFEIHPHLETSP